MMTFLIILFLAILWLVLGWLALDGDIKVKNEVLWLVLFGVPVIVICTFGILLFTIKEKRKYR